MQKDNKFFEDIAGVMNATAGGLMDIKREIEDSLRHQIEKLLQNMNLVSREEFDAVQGMLAKSRMEQEELKKRLDVLENTGKKS